MDPEEILTALKGRSTTGCGYNRAWSEEVEKEGSEVKCLYTGTVPPNKKWELDKSGGLDITITCNLNLLQAKAPPPVVVRLL